MRRNHDGYTTTVEFIVSGATGPERSAELKKLYQVWLETGGSRLESHDKGRMRVRVIITGPSRPTSVDHSVRYACGELKDGIIRAGGTIWDGTHVQITSDTAIQRDEG